jgi:malate dehydrogenase/malate dehydrogenase (NADP+)
MTRLDENRAKEQLAKKGNVSTKEVTQMAIWGNHSATQVPDFMHAKIKNVPVEQLINDHKWLESGFIQTVQQRGAEIIKARGKSSAASAANAVVDTVRSLVSNTQKGDWYSLGVCSKNNPYGIDEDLIFSFPCQTKEGKWEIVQGLKWDRFLEEKIRATEKELIEEREMVLSYVG